MRYYVEKTGPNRFDLRQERFRAMRADGNKHPHDIMAMGFTAEGMRDLIAKHFADAEIDISALEGKH